MSQQVRSATTRRWKTGFTKLVYHSVKRLKAYNSKCKGGISKPSFIWYLPLEVQPGLADWRGFEPLITYRLPLADLAREIVPYQGFLEQVVSNNLATLLPFQVLHGSLCN